MEFPNPEEYDKCNEMHIQDAKETVQKILKDDLKQYDIIVEVGCGSGNITRILSKLIPHERIYAFDHDINMVEFAQNKCSDVTIQWFSDDVGVEWNDVSSTLKELEGKVSLVWSNYVLQWVDDKQMAMKNIARLLKPNGRCYLSFPHVPNFNELLPRNEREQNEQFIKFLTHDEDLQLWKKILSESGLSSFEILEIPRVWESKLSWNILVQASDIVTKFFKETIPEEKKQDYLEKYRNVYLRALATKPGEQLLDALPSNPTGYFVQFLVTGIK